MNLCNGNRRIKVVVEGLVKGLVLKCYLSIHCNICNFTQATVETI